MPPNKITTLLFDLDGTLAEPLKAIASSLFYAFDTFKVPRPEMAVIRKFIGPPIQDSMRDLFNLPTEIHEGFLQAYRDHHGREGIYQYTFYPGIEELLKSLQPKYKLFVATSKPHPYASEILKRAGLDKYFLHIYGAEFDGTRSNKGELIAHILNEQNLKADECLMIGDRKHDILGAQTNHMKSVGVLWGYGSQDELETAGATYLISSPKDFSNLKI